MLSQLVEDMQKSMLSTSHAADSLNKSGVLNRGHALNHDHRATGAIFPVFAANGSSRSVYGQIVEAPAGGSIPGSVRRARRLPKRQHSIEHYIGRSFQAAV
jgi:hypothetical protein